MKPTAEMTPDEIDYEFHRGEMILDRLSKGLPIRDVDPVILDRAAAAFRAAESSTEARKKRTAAEPAGGTSP